MIPIITPAHMREIDAGAIDPIQELIARAGWHVAVRARALLGGVYGRRVTVIAGPGNNGADALVAADLLSAWGVRVQVVEPDAESLPPSDLIIDGAFGTGMNRPYSPARPDTPAPVLAIDIPSGVDGLTGSLQGSPLQADHTVTFAALKPGLVLAPGRELAGVIEVADIGLDVTSAQAWLFTESDAASLLPRRNVLDHKWKRAVWVIGGSNGMYGAPLLASQGALRSGSGMVWCGLPGQPAPGLASEIVFRSLNGPSWATEVMAASDRFGALVVGCGIGREAQTGGAVRQLAAEASQPLVIDGDALRLLGPDPVLRESIVLTPHDGEFASLAGHLPGPDRFADARALAASTGATVLLKGSLTIVASPDGTCLASASGDQRLATAGTGDVLAGIIGSYLAAGLEPAHAAVLGAWMHGEAAGTQTAFGMVASDLVAGLAPVTSRLIGPTAAHGELHAPH